MASSEMTSGQAINIQLATPACNEGIQQLVRSVFDEFVGVDYDDEGKQTFYEYISMENIENRSASTIRLMAESPSGQLIGVLEGCDMSHVALFFVHKDHQGKGIGRRLLAEFIRIVKERGGTTKAITLSSAPQALAIYKAIGFTPTGPEVEKNGIRTIPMALEI